MAEIAPLNYERWAVVVSPLQVSDAPEAKPTTASRHAEQLAQVSAAPSRLGSRPGEGSIGQNNQPVGLRPKTLERHSEPPVAESQPAEWVLLQPLPNGIFNAARNQPALDPRKITELYKHPEPTPGPSVRISG